MTRKPEARVCSEHRSRDTNMADKYIEIDQVSGLVFWQEK